MQALPHLGRYYRPELDVVRFLAFLLVFLHHTLPEGQNPNLNIIQHLLGGLAPIFYTSAGACRYGLSLFFTLSAFLICELLLRERKMTGTLRIKQFYIRRILRIWPLYYLALSLGLILALLHGGNRNEIETIGWYAVFMGAWHSSLYGFFDNPVVPLWSISVEEQFYLIAPSAVKYLNRKFLCVFCGVIVFCSSAWLYHLAKIAAPYDHIWADSLVQFECFAAGILLCLALRGQIPRFSLWQRLLLLPCCYLCWMAASFGLNLRIFHVTDSLGSWLLVGSYALASLGSVFLLLAFLGLSPGQLPRWAIYLGRISFGLYVYHQFAIDIARYVSPEIQRKFNTSSYAPRALLNVGLTLGLPLALTVLMAAISYRYFETPFLKMKKRHAVIESEPIADGA